MNCRFCHSPLENIFISLGKSPLSNAYLKEEDLQKKESVYPLDVYVCSQCFLVQLDAFESPQNIFSNYVYFSSYSETWLKHAKYYVNQMMERFDFNKDSRIVEIASNDGYLLQYFLEKGMDVLGIEPAVNVAERAKEKGVPTEIVFFGMETAQKLVRENKQADLLLGNNVLAHVPDLNDFVEGLKIILKPEGIITIEFPHLKCLMDDRQFDTIYHEHFSYFSFLTVQNIFEHHGLIIFDVEQLTTHGGSLRIYARHKKNNKYVISHRVSELIQIEREEGFGALNKYRHFVEDVRQLKKDIQSFFIKAKQDGKTVVGYGAPAKGNTLLNYCAITSDMMKYTVDKSPHKQGLFLPGSHIPIYHPDKIKETQPDYIFILPWNIKEEIMEQLCFIKEWGGQFVVPVPSVEVMV